MMKRQKSRLVIFRDYPSSSLRGVCLIDLWCFIVGHQSSVEPNLLCLCVYVRVHPCISTGVCVSVQDKSLTQTRCAMNHCAAMPRI